MARLIDDAASEYLQVESPVITAYPFAMACWFNSDNDADSQVLMWVGDKDVVDYWCALRARGNIAGDPVDAFCHLYGAAAAGSAPTTSGYTANTWHAIAGIWLAAGERHAYIDGGNKGSNTTVVGAMANHDRTAIGAARDSSVSGYYSGLIAETAIWDLTDWGANDAERETNFEKVVASLAKGFTPSCFLLGLKAYWPLVRGLNDGVSGFNMTASGTIVSSHPKIIQPCRGL